jgi:type III pantothenate kinase
MILCIDIGNSRVKGALFDDKGKIRSRFAEPAVKDDPSVFLSHLYELKQEADFTVVSSVAPEIDQVIRDHQCGADILFVDDSIPLPLRFNYEKGKLGPDRIAAAAGAVALYPAEDCVIADAGTALTFGVILSDGVFDGGLITAGPVTSIDALSGKASRLHKIPFEMTETLVARSTDDALCAGFYHGFSALVDGIILRIEKKYGRVFRLILTGGCSHIISQGISHPHLVDDELAIKGLYVIGKLNMK